MTVGHLTISQDALAAFCRANGIRSLAVFGSVLRDDFTEASDVDMLVEFEPGKRVGLFAFARIERELSELIGRKVDLNTEATLSRYFRDEVMAEVETLYIAA